MIGITIDHLYFWVSHKNLLDLAKGQGIVNVIGVEPGNDIAGGLPDALIHRIRLTAIGLTNPMESILIPPEDGYRFVGATPITDQVLKGHPLLG
jgi:hypothetical protein